MLRKMKKNEKKVLLMMCMQFLRHYCMDQVQRVPVKISGQNNHPFAVKAMILVLKIKIYTYSNESNN